MKDNYAKEQFSRFIHGLQEEEIDPSVMRWMLECLTPYLNGKEKSLEHALGLNVGRGRRSDSMPAYFQKQRRLRLLYNATQYLDGGPSHKAEFISELIRVHRDGEGIPNKKGLYSAVRLLLIEAPDMPTSRSQLITLIKEAESYQNTIWSDSDEPESVI